MPRAGFLKAMLIQCLSCLQLRCYGLPTHKRPLDPLLLPQPMQITGLGSPETLKTMALLPVPQQRSPMNVVYPSIGTKPGDGQPIPLQLKMPWFPSKLPFHPRKSNVAIMPKIWASNCTTQELETLAVERKGLKRECSECQDWTTCHILSQLKNMF